MRTTRKAKENALTTIKVAANVNRRHVPNRKRCSVCMVAHYAGDDGSANRYEPFVLNVSFDKGELKLRLKGRKVNRHLFLCLVESRIWGERVKSRSLYLCDSCCDEVSHSFETERDVPLCAWCLTRCNSRSKYVLNNEDVGFCGLKCLESYRSKSRSYKGPLAACKKCRRCWEPGPAIAKIESESEGSQERDHCEQCNGVIRDTFMPFGPKCDGDSVHRRTAKVAMIVEGQSVAEERDDDQNEDENEVSSEESEVAEARPKFLAIMFNYVFGWTGIRV